MNWNAVSAVAEVIGVVAIFISLVYVARQIKQNTQQLKRSASAEELAAFERNIESGNRTREFLISDPETTKTFLKGLKNYDELSGAEKFRFSMIIRNILSATQGAYVRQTSMQHDPEQFVGTTSVLDDLLVNPGVRQWLKQNKPDWRPEFRDFVNERLEQFNQTNTKSDKLASDAGSEEDISTVS